NNCTTSCGASLDVVENPSCTIDPPIVQIGEGESQEFCVQPTGGTPPYTYLWSPGGEVTQCITVSPPAGSYTYWVKVTDANNCTTSCEATLTVGPCECCPSVWIGTVDCVNPGDYVALPIYLECTPAFCGFELEVEFDYTALCFVSAERGPLLEVSYTDVDGIFWSWEMFTYRLLPCPIPPCQKYKILLYGMCEIPNGSMSRGLPIPTMDPCVYDTLVLLNFVVMNDENLRGYMIPVCWEWEGTVVNDTLVEDWDCGENTFSSPSGDTLYTSHLLCQFKADLCDDPNAGIAPIMNFQPDTNCVPDCYRICGGIVVCPADSAHCKRGDVNYNTMTYEVADAVLFASYFVEGTSVFRYDLAYQKCATDVNADGRSLTLSDLVYLIRVILHDAYAIPKLAPSSEVVNVIVYNNTITTECASPIAAILFEFDSAVNPTLLATNMEMANKDNRVLVWSKQGNTIEATTAVLSFAGDAELTSVSAVNYDTRELLTSITVKVAPAAFALNPAYPNPFNPFTNLSFTLPEALNYTLKIYNVAGQLVRSYEGMGSVGLNVVSWDGKDNAGGDVASGVYFYKLTAGSFSAIEKMVMMK
ncbi:MAG: T9SS type A sorting domain-containing protein, partial [candidate division Zixibacteria bacterium]|nr:T9SS type A sorting domain-containing protein [candidate division Zixibacteria bacterium]